MSVEEIDMYRNLFDGHDFNSSGTIDIEELKVSRNKKPSPIPPQCIDDERLSPCARGEMPSHSNPPTDSDGSLRTNRGTVSF